METPQFDLAEIKRAAAVPGRLHLGKRGCLDELRKHVPSGRHIEFAKRAIAGLSQADFGRRVVEGGFRYDAYGAQLSPALLASLDVDQHKTTWYVGVTLSPSPTGEHVFVVSFHRLKKEHFRRANGSLLVRTW